MSKDNTGEIFILAVPDGRTGEIEQNEDYNFIVHPSLLQENVYRVQCVGQPRIQHISVGYRRGFARSLSFKTAQLTVLEYNELLRWMNNHRLAFFVPDETGHIQMLYDPRHRVEFSVLGTDEAHHEICAETSPLYPFYTPISLFVHQDGSPITMEELEAMTTKK